MKKTTKTISTIRNIAFALSIISIQSISAQSEKMVHPQTEKITFKGANAADPNDVSLNRNMQPVSEKMQAQIEKVKQLRRENVRTSELTKAEATLREMNGLVRKAGDSYQGRLFFLTGKENKNESTSSINNVIINANPDYVHGLATATEQRGANAGRVWVVYGAAGTLGTSADTVKLYYSDTFGASWVYYAYGIMGGTDYISWDDLDIEIIENTTGDKYMQVVYGYNTGGNKRIGGISVDITSVAGTFWALSWPGDPANQYYGARITSDNVQWPGLAYVFITCSYDSSLAGFKSQKLVEVANPYVDTIPAFDYKPDNIYWYTPSSSAVLGTDITCSRSTDDSLIVSFSGVNDSTRVFFTRFSEYNLLLAGMIATNYDGTTPTNYKKNAKLASHGVDDGSAICVFNELVSGNWNVKYWRSLEYGYFDSGHTVGNSIYWGSYSYTNFQPDVVGVRGGTTYYFSFNTVASTADSLHYVQVTNTGGTTHLYQMNLSSILMSGTQGSKPGFTYQNGDSCFAVFTRSGPYEVWSANGCTGATVDVPQIAGGGSSFFLGQNMPNPFSNQTEINYSLAKAENVSLKVFDATGQLVYTISDGNVSAGQHKVVIDTQRWTAGVYYYSLRAGNEVATKKMVMVK